MASQATFVLVLAVSFLVSLGANAQESAQGLSEPISGMKPTDDVTGQQSNEDELSDAQFDRRLSLQNSWLGSTGGIHVVDAAGGPTRSFRVSFNVDFFAKNGFLFEDDGAGRVGGTLGLSFSPHNNIELYASLESYANTNSTEFPPLFLVLSEGRIGAKAWFSPSSMPFFRIGGGLELHVPTGPTLGASLSATSLMFRSHLSLDFREAKKSLPFIARFNLGYLLDNTSTFFNEGEEERYAQLENPRPADIENRHLLTRVERYGMGIRRTDMVNVALGFEGFFNVSKKVTLRPIVEWTWGIPVNRKGYVCPFVPEVRDGETPAPGDDDCLDRVGIAAFPMTLTLGMRVDTPLRGLSAMLGADIGLTGTNNANSVREIPMNHPYRILLGVSYSHDTRPPKIPDPIIREIEKRVEVDPDAPVLGRVHGSAVDADSGEVIQNVRIAYPGKADTAQVGADGSFVSYRFAPGVVRMELSASGYAPSGCDASIPEGGGPTAVVCKLEKTLVEVQEQEVVILEQIQFAFDSAEILEASFGLMDQIAKALRDHTEITSIEIQGHTDSQGSADYNAKLSQERADSVRSWLVEHGVEPKRLRARGYGLIKPLVPNTSEANMAINRRVQFVIESRGN